MISGPFRETSYSAITLNRESTSTRQEKSHFLFHLKHIDVTRATHTTLDVMQGKPHQMIIGTPMDQEICPASWAGYCAFHLIEREASQRIHVVRGENDKTGSNIKA